MKKIKKNKYRLGTQEVAVPEKGSVNDIGASTMTMTATGMAAGATLGPIGAGVGAAAGAITGAALGYAKYNQANKDNKRATDHNAYLQRNTYVEDPNLMQMQQFPDGTKGVRTENGYKVNGNEVMVTKASKRYKKPIPKQIPHYEPTLYGHNFGQLENRYNMGTEGIDNIKPVEVEKDELIFKKKGNRYILKADFKGGKTHGQGGEDYTAQEGDVIFPGDKRKKVLNAYRRGDTASLETMRMSLPKDTNKAKDGFDYTDDIYGRKTADPFDITGMDFSTDTSNPETNVARGGFGDYTDPNMPSNIGTSEFGKTPTTPAKTGYTGAGAMGALSTGMEVAPIVYNAIRGAGKASKVNRNYYNPERYQYSDISSPARRAAQESQNVDNYNIRTTRGARGQVQSYLQQASNNKYKRLADIGNFEGGRKMDVYNKNIEQDNQAKAMNLNLSNQYNDMDAQNRARRNDFSASAVSQASSFAQNRRLMDNQRKRDQALMARDKQTLSLYNSMYPDYMMDYDTSNMELKGIKYKTRKYAKGTRKINRY